MDRMLYKDLEAWRLAPPRKPLLLLGARQVRKTFALKKFV